MTNRSTRTNRGAASSQTAREINRDIILNTVHLHQPVSRADLARLTGLQASTTSVIIGQLIEEGWVSPGILGHLPRGRRPTFVTLNDKHVSLAVDLRPEKATVGAVDINGKILSQTIVEFSSHIITKSEARKAIAKIVNIAQMLRVQFKGRVLEGVGVSVSGRVDQEAHRLIFSPNAPWSDMDLCNDLRKLLNTPIEMENAANASLFAERWFGKLGGVSNIVVVSVSEGIGTGILLDGRLVRGRESLAGEFGHMPFESTGPLCGCGNVGCWEVFASNRAALRYYKETVPDSELTSFRDLLDLAKSGDIRALRSIDRMASYLARGLAILAAGLAPEVIVIVGDCTALWPRICPIIESELIARSFTSRIPRVAPATDGDSARLLGAAALISYKALFRHTSFEQLHRVKLDRLGKHAS